MYDVFQTDRLIDLWLSEDIGSCDLTAQLMIDEDAVGTFHMNAREPMYIAGIDVADAIRFLADEPACQAPLAAL